MQIIIELRERIVKMYHHHHRGEYDQQEEINKQIDQLRQTQIQIASTSKLAIQYTNQIICFNQPQRYEKIRIYHRMLDFSLG